EQESRARTLVEAARRELPEEHHAHTALLALARDAADEGVHAVRDVVEVVLAQALGKVEREVEHLPELDGPLQRERRPAGRDVVRVAELLPGAAVAQEALDPHRERDSQSRIASALGAAHRRMTVVLTSSTRMLAQNPSVPSTAGRAARTRRENH